MNAALTWLLSWWTSSPVQVSIVVTLFWLAMVWAILAIVGANNLGERK